MPLWLVLLAGSAALAIICLFVHRQYGRSAAVTAAALGLLSLSVLGLAYGVLPLEDWRRGHLGRTLLVFAAPAIVALLLAWMRQRRLNRATVLYVVALWVGPSLLIWSSQLRPFQGTGAEFANLMWFAGCSIGVYTVIPIVYAAVCRQSIRAYGLSLVLLRREWILFAGAIPALLAAVWFFSSDPGFDATYPFYDNPSSWQSLLLWEIAYGATFVALEFFFRGFLVFAGQPVLGVDAVAVMAFSYCLIHLAKPIPEAVSSLIGGLVLGYLALRFRSILVGIAAHLTIAWGMDGSVLIRRGGGI